MPQRFALGRTSKMPVPGDSIIRHLSQFCKIPRGTTEARALNGANLPDFYIVSPGSELFFLPELKGTFFQNFRIFSKTLAYFVRLSD